MIHLLVDVVAKGGNLALNVAPGPDGRLPWSAIDHMNTMGAWLAKNGKAIYGTRPLEPWRVGDWAFTQGKDGTAYAIRLWKDGERRILRLVVPNDFDNAAVRRVVHLASGTEIPFERTPDGLLLRLPDSLVADEYADAFVVSR